MRYPSLAALFFSTVWSGAADTSVVEAEASRGSPDAALVVEEAKQDEPTAVLNSGDHGKRQIEWVRANGGFVHEAFEIRRVDLTDPESRFGVIAKTDLKKDEVILVIPRDLLIDSEDEEGDICTTVFNLAREMQLGSKSKYEPYVSYLNSQAYGQLPTMWSNAGKEALRELLDFDEEYQDHILPPANAYNTGHDCTVSTLFEKNAEMLVRQRSWDDILIPVWDMVSHRNGHWLNVEEKYSVHDTHYPVTAIANRDILAGEELYMSYSLCPDCSNRYTGYGTAEIMRDYGFVENFPQKWVFEDQEMEFGLDYEYNEDGSIVTEDESGLVFNWFPESGFPDETDLAFFEEQLERVKALDLSEKPDAIPKHEWDVIVGYRHAISVAMERLVVEAQTVSIDEFTMESVAAPKFGDWEEESEEDDEMDDWEEESEEDEEEEY